MNTTHVDLGMYQKFKLDGESLLMRASSIDMTKTGRRQITSRQERQIFFHTETVDSKCWACQKTPSSDIIFLFKGFFLRTEFYLTTGWPTVCTLATSPQDISHTSPRHDPCFVKNSFWTPDYRQRNSIPASKQLEIFHMIVWLCANSKILLFGILISYALVYVYSGAHACSTIAHCTQQHVCSWK